jgi:hypothetical protein
LAAPRSAESRTVAGAVALAALVLSLASEERWAWMGAVWFGVTLGVWFDLVDAVPKHIQNWATGADGERRTERALRPLERAGWLVAHDLDNRLSALERGGPRHAGRSRGSGDRDVSHDAALVVVHVGESESAGDPSRS